MDDLSEADRIEAVIQRTGHWRYRELLAADPDAWRPILLRSYAELFEGSAPAAVPPEVPQRGNFEEKVVLVWGCDYREKAHLEGQGGLDGPEGCGCQAICLLTRRRVARECYECVASAAWPPQP